MRLSNLIKSNSLARISDSRVDSQHAVPGQHVQAAVEQARHALRRQSSTTNDSLTPAQLDGWCELAEAVEYHHLLSQGHAPEVLHSNQVGELGGAYRHAFLVVDGQSEPHLLDPTFGQFFQRGPGQSLQETAKGRMLLSQLLQEGHAPWSPLNAQLYAEAMGIPGSLYERALESQRPMLYQPGLFASLLA
jgi:hypothetical protein